MGISQRKCWDGAWRGQKRTLELCWMDSGTRGAIWNSRSEGMVEVF